MEAKLSLTDLDVKGKTVLVRVDYNVPLTPEGTIADATRIEASLPTLQYLLDHQAALVLMSHLGRPRGTPEEKFSLAPCAQHLSTLLKRPVKMAPATVGKEVEQLVHSLKPGELLLLENLRFNPGEEFPEKDPSFVQQLAQLGDFYVNDAFGTAHRCHSSTEKIAPLFPGKAAAGLLMDGEISHLKEVLLTPCRPFWAVLGGAKVSTKLAMIHALLDQVDGLIIGGAMAFTFLEAQGKKVGHSLVEKELIKEANLILQRCESQGISVILPSDVLCAEEFSPTAAATLTSMEAGIPKECMGLDIGPKTIQNITVALQKAGSILWNGPMGAFELPPFSQGTLQVAQAIGASSAKSVVGGGDSLAAIKMSGLAQEFTHLSTGGGATLEFLEKASLPAIEALSSPS